MYRVFRNIYLINQFFKEAEIQLKNKKWQEALELFIKSHKANPDHQPTVIGKSKCMLNLQKQPEASKLLEQIKTEKLTPEERQDLLQLQGRIELTKPDFDKAKEFFEQSIEFSEKE
jgi:tetratricopeptide (TPR) repeat protein